MINPHRIKFADGVQADCIFQPVSCVRTFRDFSRAALLITTALSYEEVASRFIDGVSFSVMSYEELLNVSGLPSREYDYVEYPKPEYIVAGDIVDKRDGTISVLMGKKTQLELLEEENAELLYFQLTGEVL